jgi:hypothetical protein
VSIVILTGPVGFTFKQRKARTQFSFPLYSEGPFKDVDMGEYIGFTGGKVYLNGKRCTDYIKKDD